MAGGLTDVTLNIMSAVVVSVVLATHVRSDMIMLSFVAYAVVFAATFLVPGGGQLNAGLASSVVIYALLSWTTEDMLTPTLNSLISQHERVPLFEGYLVMNAHTHRTFDTYDPQNSTYRRLSLSQNRMGGAQFSYTFWLNMGGLDDSVAGKTIFMRGDKRAFSPQVRASGEAAFEDYFASGSDVTICCPRVYFKSANTLGVQVNTDRELVFEAQVGNPHADPAVRKNALSLIPKHWAMVTVVVEDNVSINDFESGIAVRTYLNDVLYGTSVSPGSLRLNNAPLHLLCADSWPADSRMSDFIYYNYALTDAQVQREFSRGVQTHATDDVGTFSSDLNPTLSLGDRNKLDVYNYGSSLQPLTL